MWSEQLVSTSVRVLVLVLVLLQSKQRKLWDGIGSVSGSEIDAPLLTFLAFLLSNMEEQ